MKESTKTARKEIKKLIETIGLDNIKNYHITDIRERTGCTITETQNAMSYFRFRKTA